MSKNRITTATRLTILKHLANGKSLEVVAEITKLDRFEVLDVASHHGYPDLEKVAKAAVLVDERIRRDSLAQLEAPHNPAPTPAPMAAPSERRSRTAGAGPAATKTPLTKPTAASSGASAPVGEETTLPLTRPDEIRVAINAGKQSGSKRIQALTDKILSEVDRLKGLLADEQAKHEAARRKAAERAALQEKKARLVAQLAEVNAALRGRGAATSAAKTASTSTSAADVDAKTVRRWAREVGIECPDTGRIPGALREAYAEAHNAAAADVDDQAA